jgi:hypothetical protein
LVGRQSGVGCGLGWGGGDEIEERIEDDDDGGAEL